MHAAMPIRLARFRAAYFRRYAGAARHAAYLLRARRRVQRSAFAAEKGAKMSALMRALRARCAFMMLSRFTRRVDVLRDMRAA